MNKIIKAVVVGFVCVGSVWALEAKMTYRDAMGRKQGTSEVDRYGKTTYRDSLGVNREPPRPIVTARPLSGIPWDESKVRRSNAFHYSR